MNLKQIPGSTSSQMTAHLEEIVKIHRNNQQQLDSINSQTTTSLGKFVKIHPNNQQLLNFSNINIQKALQRESAAPISS